MSELINNTRNKINTRWQLLVTASVVALLGAACTVNEAKAETDNDRPTVWIELGGQLSRLSDSQEEFVQSFPVSRPSIFSPSQRFERPPSYSIDETGELAFEPSGSEWVFAASIHYGRSTSHKDVRQQTFPKPYAVQATCSGQPCVAKYNQPIANRFADTNSRNSESHTILDFQVGKDVGLGIFGGSHGSSVLNFGVRFAQFSAKSNIAIKSDPDWHFNYKYAGPLRVAPFQPYHTNLASLQASRNFHGIGPSLSWSASAPVLNTSQDSGLTFDWGINAAVLFGRQRASVHHDALAQYHPPVYGGGARSVTYSPAPVNVSRTHSIAVPNVGASAGLSFNYANAKISAGYRADIFFGAMDGGIDTLKTYDRGFYGPFATVSIGFGG